MTKQRCFWVNPNNKEYIDYHDKEWGRPIKDDHEYFEMIILEGAQAGLSWETVLKKREHYRKVFKNFDPQKVARITPSQVEKILLDPGIIRNRLKVESTVSNAKAFLKVQKEFGSFHHYMQTLTNGEVIFTTFKNASDYPTKSALSDMISKDLKKRGFKFVGSTIIYAYLQAIGYIQAHSSDCYLGGKQFKVRKRNS